MSDKEDDASHNCNSFSIGSFITILLSWHVNHSVLYAFIYGLFSWIYVLYWMFTYWDKHSNIPWQYKENNMGLPHHAHLYGEQADLDWAVDRFCHALKSRLFEEAKRGKRGWQCCDGALEKAEQQICDAKVANTAANTSKELLDAAAFIFMEWWKT